MSWLTLRYLMTRALEMLVPNPEWVLTQAGLQALAERMIDGAAHHPYWPRVRMHMAQEISHSAQQDVPSTDPVAYGEAVPLVVAVRRGTEEEAEYLYRPPYYAFTLRMIEPYGSVNFYIGALDCILDIVGRYLYI